MPRPNEGGAGRRSLAEWNSLTLQSAYYYETSCTHLIIYRHIHQYHTICCSAPPLFHCCRENLGIHALRHKLWHICAESVFCGSPVCILVEMK